MIMQLIRKDILLVKKYMIVIVAFIVAAQVLPMVFSTEPTAQDASFLIGLIFGQLIFFTTLSQLDSRYPKATALLCSAPYTRSTFVKARYVLLLLLFVFSYIVNIIVTLVLGSTSLLSPAFIIATLLIDVIIFGIYIPLEFRYGYTKVRFIYIAVIIVVAFLPQVIVGLLSPLNEGAQSSGSGIIENIFMATQSVPVPVLCLIMVVAIIAILYISIRKSIKIFNKKEL